jgi:4'-phosphopantetheinyl transferase
MTLPARGEVLVRLTGFDLQAAAAESEWALLDAAEREKARRFVYDVDRVRYVKSHAFLRRVLGHCLQVPPATIGLQADALGKPQLASPSPVRFNLAHSGAMAAVAVAVEREVGIDIEPLDRAVDAAALSRRILSDRERDAWSRTRAAAGAPDLFLHYWCRKEAILKACGWGLRLEPRALETGVSGRTSLILPIEGGSGRFCVQEITVEGHAAAVAAAGDDWQATVRYDRV